MEQIDDQVATLLALAEGSANVAEIKSRCISLFQDSDNNPRPVFILRSTYLKRQEREEENIYYVAITRSKHELVFVSSEE